MSEYPEAGFLKEFVRRTKCNLALIEKTAKEINTEAYEVTQLFNSLLGLLILPKEKYYDQLREVMDKEVPVFQRCKHQIRGRTIHTINYQQAIRHLRNAVGHPNNLKALVFELCDVLTNKISAVEGL